MAALEYLTHNSLTAYPFKPRKGENSIAYPIADDWFYDILFVAKTQEIKRVYISYIEKTSGGAISITFSSADEYSFNATVTINSVDVVDHYKNLNKSFAYADNSYFSVKLLFGPGLVSKEAFSQTYDSADAELLSAAIILASPRINSLSFENHGGLVEATYTNLEVPQIKVRYNTAFVLEAVSQIGLEVGAGLGDGLYDPCPSPGGITDVYTINSVKPNDSGALFLDASSCYSVNNLTNTDELLLGTLLDKYRTFTIYTSPTETAAYNAVDVGRSITLQNFCKPKCPPENINAFAHYLNRVTDGAQELANFVARSKETRGTGAPALNIFSVNAFCVATPFDRCTDPTDPAYIQCEQKFIKYFHEGRTLQLLYSSTVIRNYTIVDVLPEAGADSYRVKLNATPPPVISGTYLPFRVLDNGVISNINCAASSYNTTSETLASPYYKVKHSTTEAYNPEGVYVTYVSVIVTAFNPSVTSETLRVDFSNTILVRQGGFKIITPDGTSYSSDDPQITIGCREYAFVYATYYIPCETFGGDLQITVNRYVSGEFTPIGYSYSLPTIDGGICPGTITGGTTFKRRLKKPLWETFSETLNLGSHPTSVVFFNKPAWLEYSLNSGAGTLTITAAEEPDLEVNTVYSVNFRISGGDSQSIVNQLLLDYVVLPVVTSPLATSFTSLTPLILSKSTLFTTANPAFQIFAANMLVLSAADYPSDSNVYYDATGLPLGLTLDQTTGIVTGQLDPSLAYGASVAVTVTAYNPAGQASNPQIINLQVAQDAVPELSINNPPTDNIFNISNFDQFTVVSPLFTLNVTNPPIIRYMLTGTLPAGLSFNTTTGSITGKITVTTAGSSSFEIYAENEYGASNVIEFSVAYEIFYSPNILQPDNLIRYPLNIDNETTLESPLFTILATQAFGGTDNFAAGLTNNTRNKYTALGIPPGFYLDLYTGKFYGKLSSAELPSDPEAPFSATYPIRLFATNLVGEDAIDVFLEISKAGAPVINNIAAGSVLFVTKGRVYTEENPFLAISATNNPTSFSASNLPSGLACQTSGKITGIVLDTAEANTFPVSITATNGVGTSAAVAVSVKVPVKITSVASGDIFNLGIGASYPSAVTITTSPVVSGDSVQIQVTGLPSGLSYSAGKIQGTPTSITTASVRITASTTNHGTDIVNIIINVSSGAYSVSGNIVDGDSEPVSGVTVSAGGDNETTTDLAGNYTISTLPPGTYNITASKAGFVFSPNRRAVTITTANLIAVDFEMTDMLRFVRGTILTLPSSSPLANATVTAASENSSTIAFTNQAGEYAFYLGGSNSYTITPSSPGYAFTPADIVIPSGTADISSQDFSATIAYTLSGTIITPRFSSVVVQAVNTTTLQTRSITSLNNAFTFQLGAGAYNLTVNPDNQPLVLAATSESVVYEFSTTASQPINLTSSRFGVQFFGTRQYRVLGNVSVAKPSTETGINIPLSGITVESYILETQALTALTNTSGNYSIVGLAQGTYSVTPKKSGQAIASTQTATILNNDVTLNFLASVPIYSLSGAVIFNSAKLGGAEIQLRDTITNTLYRTETTVSGEDFNFSGIPEGSYKVIPVNTPDLTYLPTQYIVSISSASISGLNFAAELTSSILPGAPTVDSHYSGYQTIELVFNTPVNTGTTIYKYQYELNASGSWLDLATNRTITGLNANTSYNIKLRAVNLAGPGPASTTYTATTDIFASAPTIESIVFQNKQLTVNYTPPTTIGGGVVIDRYNSYVNNNLYTAAIVSLPTNSIVLPNLVNGVTYSVKIRAAAVYAEGDASETIQATPEAVPDAPAMTSVLAAADSLTLSFTPPADTGGYPILSYNYRAVNQSSPNDISVFPALTTTSPIVISDLIASTTYSAISVQAINEIGAGVWSNTRTITLPGTAPVTVPEIVVTRGLGSLTVNITAPSDDGGRPIISYTIQTTYYIGEEMYQSSYTHTQLQNPFVLSSGVIDTAEYTVKVWANNNLGFGPFAVAVVGALVPAAAPELASTLPADGQITFTLQAPTDLGTLPLWNYQYRYKETTDTGDPAWITLSPPSTTGIIAVTGLTNGVLYNFQFRALTGTSPGLPGASLYSDLGAFAARAGIPPGQPAISLIEPQDNALLLTITPSSLVTGFPTTTRYYKASINNGSYADLGLAQEGKYLLSASINPIFTLVNGTDYAVRVKESNPAGLSPASDPVTGNPGRVPYAPFNFSAISSSQQTAISFSTANQTLTGRPVTGFKYAITQQGDVDNFIATAQLTSPVQLTGLNNGVPYTFKLQQVNNIGDGEIGTLTDIVAGNPPDAPTITQVAATTEGLQLFFNPPVNNGGSAITGYYYSVYTSAQNSGWIGVGLASSPIAVNNFSFIEPNSVYSLSMLAQNSVSGNYLSAAAASAQGITLPGIPSIPSEYPIVRTNNGLTIPQIQIPGNAPTLDILYSLTASSPFVSSGVSSAPISAIADNKKYYEVAVKTVNSSGTGPESSRTVSLPISVPAAPTIQNVLVIDGNIQVFFTVNSTGNLAATNIEYSINHRNGSTYTARNPASVTSPLIIPNAPGYETIRIRVVNLLGSGEASTSWLIPV